MKIAIYARVSDDKKKSDGERRQDVYRQIDFIEAHLKRAGIKEWKKYIDDGKSAFREDINQRPEFKRLINDCLRHYVKEIYIEDMTRFSRNLSLGIKWLTRLGEIGVTLISLKEGQIEYTSSKGWLQSNLLLLFSEWESRIRSEKVKEGMQRAKEKGKHTGRPKNSNRGKS